MFFEHTRASQGGCEIEAANAPPRESAQNAGQGSLLLSPGLRWSPPPSLDIHGLVYGQARIKDTFFVEGGGTIKSRGVVVLKSRL